MCGRATLSSIGFCIPVKRLESDLSHSAFLDKKSVLEFELPAGQADCLVESS